MYVFIHYVETETRNESIVFFEFIERFLFFKISLKEDHDYWVKQECICIRAVHEVLMTPEILFEELTYHGNLDNC